MSRRRRRTRRCLKDEPFGEQKQFERVVLSVPFLRLPSPCCQQSLPSSIQPPRGRGRCVGREKKGRHDLHLPARLFRSDCSKSLHSGSCIYTLKPRSTKTSLSVSSLATRVFGLCYCTRMPAQTCLQCQELSLPVVRENSNE